jgi:hypothetical protein
MNKEEHILRINKFELMCLLAEFETGFKPEDYPKPEYPINFYSRQEFLTAWTKSTKKARKFVEGRTFK